MAIPFGLTSRARNVIQRGRTRDDSEDDAYGGGGGGDMSQDEDSDHGGTMTRIRSRFPWTGNNNASPINSSSSLLNTPINIYDLTYGKHVELNHPDPNLTTDIVINPRDSPSVRKEKEEKRRIRGLLLLPDQGPQCCFSCRHIGENSPGIESTHLQVFEKTLFSYDTTHLDIHVVEMHDMYEILIRQPTNMTCKPNETPLPPWNPATIKSHILYHVGQPKNGLGNIARALITTGVYISQNLILESVPGGGITTNKNNMATLKGIIDSTCRIYKVKDKDLAPFVPILGSNNSSKSKIGFIDRTHKKTVETGNVNVVMGCHFHSDALNKKTNYQSDLPEQVMEVDTDEVTEQVTSNQGHVPVY